MRQIRMNGVARVSWVSYAILSGVCLSLALSGCISIPDSQRPRFYMLRAADTDQARKSMNIAGDVLVGIGPVEIPEYLNRPHMVTQGKEKLLVFAQFDRWGESLDAGIARLLRENLTVVFPETKFTLYPWDPAMRVDYQVMVELVQLDSDIKNDLFLGAQWMIIDAQHSKTLVTKRSEFKQPIIPQDYSGLAKTLSTACAALSGEISESLATLETQPKTREEEPALKE